MSNVKTSYVHGAAIAKATNPVGDNYVANFTRGFALYYDADVAAKRNVVIDADKAAFKAYLLAK
jgi:hypothetical protein